jgi:hypothetical protein
MQIPQMVNALLSFLSRPLPLSAFGLQVCGGARLQRTEQNSPFARSLSFAAAAGDRALSP